MRTHASVACIAAVYSRCMEDGVEIVSGRAGGSRGVTAPRLQPTYGTP